MSKEMVKRFYEGNLANGKTDDVGDYFAADFVDHDPPGPLPPGIPGVVAVVEMMQRAMPQRTTTVHDLLEDGDRVAIRFTLHGEQTGPFPGRPEKRGPMEIDVIALLRVANGKIVERWGQARVR